MIRSVRWHGARTVAVVIALAAVVIALATAIVLRSTAFRAGARADASGPDATRPPPIGVYVGHLYEGQELSSFRPCNSDESWWPEFSEEALAPSQVALDEAEPNESLVRSVFVRVRGIVGGDGSVGHRGGPQRRIRILEILEARPTKDGDCRADAAQRPDDDKPPRRTETLTPRRLSVPFSVERISASDGSVLLLSDDGRVFAWDRPNDQLWDQPPAPVDGLPPIASVAAGDGFSLALGKDGRVWAWRRGSTPTVVPLVRRARSIAVGTMEALALFDDGSVAQFETCTRDDVRKSRSCAAGYIAAFAPANVAGIHHAVGIAASSGRLLALDARGTVWFWHQSGLGHTDPVEIKGIGRAAAVALGTDHAVAVDRGGVVWAWGKHGIDPSGGVSDGGSELPIRIPIPEKIVAVTARGSVSYGLSDSGAVWTLARIVKRSWLQPTSTAPRTVPGLPAMRRIATAQSFALGTAADGGVWAWGERTRLQ